ncbi:hypothetical protein L798_10123 [Zootermopsis nevadensis]|uniref:Uncharacterized protein n=1 Tax=Zootermopsis nevadensis TaxID=136037 RepID=A0A067R2Q7_ZOONE|nr:hypothetical protein L798_10123 [Zootermopsis nevadensis]
MLMTRVIGQNIVYSDQYFKFGQSLTGTISTFHAANLSTIMLSSSQHKKSIQQTGYMPIFNSLRMKYGIYPGILMSENQNENQTAKVKTSRSMKHWHQMLPIIKCIVPNEIAEGRNVILGRRECVSLDYELSPDENHVMNIVHRDTRNVSSRISLGEKKATQELDRKHSVIEMPSTNMESFLKKNVSVLIRNEKDTDLLLPLLSGSSSVLSHECGRQTDRNRDYQGSEDHKNPIHSKIPIVSKSSGFYYSSSFSSSKTKSKGGFKMFDISDYEILPESDGCEIAQNCDPLEINRNELPRTLTVPGHRVLKYDRAPSSSPTNIRDSSFLSDEPYPLPEAPSLILLEPLLLMQQDIRDGSRSTIAKKRKEQMTHCEQQRVARIMIGYTLAFFLLAIVTFYVVYFI